MISLRFNPQGSFHPEYGITPDDVLSMEPTLNDLRLELIETDKLLYESGDPPAEKQPLDARFLWLPEETLDGYAKNREQSELGRIFKVANSIHDEIDAVAVLGIGGSYMGALSLIHI